MGVVRRDAADEVGRDGASPAVHRPTTGAENLHAALVHGVGYACTPVAVSSSRHQVTSASESVLTTVEDHLIEGEIEHSASGQLNAPSATSASWAARNA